MKKIAFIVLALATFSTASIAGPFGQYARDSAAFSAYESGSDSHGGGRNG